MEYSKRILLNLLNQREFLFWKRIILILLKWGIDCNFCKNIRNINRRMHIPVSWLTIGCDNMYVTKWWRLSNCTGPKKHRPVVMLYCMKRWLISSPFLKKTKHKKMVVWDCYKIIPLKQKISSLFALKIRFR